MSVNLCQLCFKYSKRLIPHIKTFKLQTEWDENVIYVCKECHDELHRHKEIDIESDVAQLMMKLGLDLEDENFRETPRRFGSWLLEYTQTDWLKTVEECASAVFCIPDSVMVVHKDIHSYSMCPHHFLPVRIEAAVAYIAHGYCIGLSKIKRIVDAACKRPVLQEQLTQDIGRAIRFAARTPDVMILIKANHLCMEFRGVRSKQDILTSYISGEFYKEHVKMEALKMLG